MPGTDGRTKSAGDWFLRDKLKFIGEIMRGSRAHFAVAAAAVAVGTLFSYLIPLIVRFTIDTVIGGEGATGAVADSFSPELSPATLAWLRDRLWLCGLAMVGCAALQGGFDYLRARSASVASETMAFNLRNRLFDHIGRLGFQTLNTLDTGDLIQRGTSDLQTIRQFLESQLVEVTRVLIMVAAALPIMLLLSPPMTAVSTAVLPVVLIGSIYYFFRVSHHYQAMAESEAAMSNVLQENLTGIRTVQAFCREPYECEKFGLANLTYRERMRDMMRIVSTYWGFSAFLCMGQICLVLVVGAWWASRGLLTIGTLAAFLTYVGMLVWPIRQLGHALSEAGRANVALNRIQAVLHKPEEQNPANPLRPPIRGGIEFRNVSFAYEPGYPALKDLSFTVEPGQTVAILGRTGSGKSTLVNLLPRLLDYASGSIRIDGVELNRIEREWIRSHIGVVLQEPFLYSKTIRENIALGDSRAHRSPGRIEPGAEAKRRMMEVVKIADIHRTIENTFHEGYETMLGERGVTLSGGQRQRLAIARALIKDPAILILDDSLSAVDAETDRRIQGALRQRRGCTTTFIISHRLSTLARADLVLVLQHGHLVQQGTHSQLIREPGLYQRIYQIQNQLEADLQREMAD